ncbi:MAG: NAD-dependent succinate-semialdehyde dehydrogenase [Opitutaceae bacterium]|nr:NAD-dependent succinate-semialdehyde dehydrogenase [Opitutaceae bacterium]
MRFTSINPATGRRIATVRAHGPAEIEQVLARAAAAQREWRGRSIARRAAVLRRLGRTLLAARDELAPLATAEMGKPIAQARAEIEKSALLCSYYARHGATILADERPIAAPAQARVTFEPLGTVLAIMPWNFPVWQAVRATVPALIGGNTVLLKPAASVAGSSRALERLFLRAGFPRGVFQLLLADNAAIARVLADSRVHAVTLTGSTAAGKKVAALAGAAMKPGVFELGGSDPALVLADADIPRAAEICAQSRLLNSGQSCVCAKRFLVERRVLADFERHLVERMSARRVGDPADPATEIGPLARADLRATLHAQVRSSVRLGARVLLGGAPTPGRGFFYPPTVLTGVRPGMPAFDEELFGPVAAIVAVRDESEAVKLANATPYGLAATVFTRNRTRARSVVRQLEAGAVFINDFVRSAPELPFGGVKESGHGRELGPWGARAFMNAKTVWEA